MKSIADVGGSTGTGNRMHSEPSSLVGSSGCMDWVNGRRKLVTVRKSRVGKDWNTKSKACCWENDAWTRAGAGVNWWVGDAFLGKSETTATLAAGGVADGGCILGLLAASAAMVSRISAIRGGVPTWKSHEGWRHISCRGYLYALVRIARVNLPMSRRESAGTENFSNKNSWKDWQMFLDRGYEER